MTKISVLFTGLTLLLSAQTAIAKNDIHLGQNVNSEKTAQNFTSCPDNFYQNTPPQLVGTKGEKLAKKTYELCFDGFAVLYSGISKTPIWSAEFLTKERIRQAKTLTREDNFHEESRLPKSAQALLSDYRQSGFDRGHLAPNGDMANSSQQFDSFSLANIAPQNGTHNRGDWRKIESSTRYLVNKYGSAYVVTGVVFSGKNIQKIGAGVLVPSHFFKAVYLPSIQKAGVYYSANTENGQMQVISLDELTNLTGISVMPDLPQSLRQEAYSLPTSAENPTKNDDNNSKKNQQNQKEDASGWAVLIAEILKFILSLFK